MLRGASATYNVPHAYLLNGRVEPAALQDALDIVLLRHPALSGRVLAVQDEPRLTRCERARCVLDVVDITGVEADQRDEAIAQFARSPLSLAEPPLLRAAIFLLGPASSVLVLVAHQGVFDRRSADLLRTEISRGYADATGTRSRAVPASRRYGPSEPAASRTTPADEELLLSYWTARLAGAPDESSWPHDRPRPERPARAGAHASFRVPGRTAARLRRLARDAGATPFTVAATALQGLLARVCADNDGDVVIGTSVTLRADPAERDLIDDLANIAALRMRIDPAEAFVDLLHRASADLRKDLAHGQYPFAWLVQRLAGSRSLARPPLVQVMLEIDDQPAPALRLGGITGSPVELHNGTAKFDLALRLTPSGDGYAGGLDYATELYDGQTAALFAKTFVDLLEDAVSNPGKQVGNLVLVRRSHPPRTRTGTARPAGPPAHERFMRQAAARPDAAALRWDSGELSYRELDCASARLSARLRAAAPPGDLAVAVCARRSPALAVALLAALRIGAGYVPLDPAYPRERLDFMLRDSRAALLVCDDDLAGAVMLPPGARLLTLDGALSEDSPATGAPAATASPGSPCYVIYTSGSTGQPRGVEMPHGPLANLLDWQAGRSAAGPGWRTLQFAPFSFDVAFQELFSTWGTGGTVVLISEDARRDPALLLDHLERHEIHRLFLPFVALQNLAESACAFERFPRHLREVVTAGEQLVVTPAIRRFFSQTGASLENQYGPSETHVVTAERLAADPWSWPDIPPIGTAITGAVVEVLDPRGHPLPSGVPGEIWVSGPVLASGYRGRPELTAERFVTGPGGKRYYRTGDFGRIAPDGRLDYLGRRDGQVKVRGHRVELGEVEARLKALPGIADAVVTAHQRDGSGMRLVAHCIPAQGAELSSRDLRDGLATGLPSYMIPATFAVVGAFPLTPSGKVDRRKLAQSPVDVGGRTPTLDQPRDDVEIQLCDVWRELLARPSVGVHDDFFELGGDSFIGVRMVAAVRRLFGVDLALADIFSAFTVAALAELIRSGTAGPSRSPLVRLQAGDGSSPVYAFHPLPGTIMRYAAFARALGPEQTVWGLQSMGLQPGEAPLSSVSEMADLYLDRMRAIRPAGPWHLVGYSMGGILAVEVARRLREAGEQVRLVGLFDTSPKFDLDAGTDYATRILVRMGLKINIDIDRLLKLDPAERTSELLERSIAAGSLPADYDTDRLRRMLDMYQHNGVALAAHRVTPYDGRVVLFRARHRPREHADLEHDLGWGDLAGEVVVHEVPGDHYHMMEATQVESLAALVLRYVRGDG